ncbi:MAG: response regulator receiver protein [Phycisphaerales bacterium]|nr:response regulator receiver protein [Phycisphaerales bacterium]
MARLSERDYLAVLGAVRRLNDEPDPQCLPRLMLDVVRRLVRAESVTFNEINPEDARQSCFSDTPDLDTVMGTLGDPWSRHLGEHPLIVRSEALRARGRTLGVSKISDFLTRRELKASGLYHSVYRHLDTEFQMAVTVVADPGKTVGIALNRKLRDFSERDREVLQLLEPHLRTCYASAMQRLRFHRLFDAAHDDEAVDDLQHLGLTRREAQTLLCIVQGKTNEQIAVELSASPRTIHKHVEHVFRKFRVSSRAAAVMKLFSHWGRSRIT